MGQYDEAKTSDDPANSNCECPTRLGPLPQTPDRSPELVKPLGCEHVLGLQLLQCVKRISIGAVIPQKGLIGKEPRQGKVWVHSQKGVAPVIDVWPNVSPNCETIRKVEVYQPSLVHHLPAVVVDKFQLLD